MVNCLKWKARRFKNKLAKIEVFMVDVDGILTDGKLYYSGAEIGFNRFFHVHDGYGMKLLKNAGIKIGMISGGDSIGLRQRAQYLQVDYLFVGNDDKRYAFDKLVSDGFKLENILYMGDELFDMPLLSMAGFSATTPNAVWEVRNIVDYITKRKSGDGCVREVVDMLRYVKNL